MSDSTGGSVYAMNSSDYATHVPELSDDNDNTPRSTLESAESYLTGSAKADRPSNGGGSQFTASFEAFLEWGEENKLIQDRTEFSFFSIAPNGRGEEHEAWFHEETNRWFKATYHNKFGLAWGRNESATPCEYLKRLCLQNKYFGDDIQLVALVRCDGKLRVLTSQPHIAGEPATYQEIQNWFCSMNLKCLQSDGCIAWYFKSENLLIADAHEGNVIRTSAGVLVPIDLNLIQPEGELFDWANA